MHRRWPKRCTSSNSSSIMKVVRNIAAKLWSRRKAEKPKIAYPGLARGVVYVVGDIHGRLDCLRRVHEAIDHDVGRVRGEEAVELYLGDYVDRGPDSRGVIDCLIERVARRRAIFLRGNHEIMLEEFLGGRLPFARWKNSGALPTLVSYGVDARQALGGEDVDPHALAVRLPDEHRAFLSALRPIVTVGDYCFVHAGVRPGIPLDEQTLDDLAWIRAGFLDYKGRFERIVVHGHSAVAEAEFHHNRINIDTGAYATGKLSVLRIDGKGPVLL